MSTAQAAGLAPQKEVRGLLMHPNPGFQSLTEELGHQFARKDRLYRLQKAIANSIEMEEDGLSTMQKKYDMYKEGNIKFLRFNPDEKISWKRRIFSRLHFNPQLFAFLSQLLE